MFDLISSAGDSDGLDTSVKIGFALLLACFLIYKSCKKESRERQTSLRQQQLLQQLLQQINESTQPRDQVVGEEKVVEETRIQEKIDPDVQRIENFIFHFGSQSSVIKELANIITNGRNLNKEIKLRRNLLYENRRTIAELEKKYEEIKKEYTEAEEIIREMVLEFLNQEREDKSKFIGPEESLRQIEEIYELIKVRRDDYQPPTPSNLNKNGSVTFLRKPGEEQEDTDDKIILEPPRFSPQ